MIGYVVGNCTLPGSGTLVCGSGVKETARMAAMAAASPKINTLRAETEPTNKADSFMALSFMCAVVFFFLQCF